MTSYNVSLLTSIQVVGCEFNETNQPHAIKNPKFNIKIYKLTFSFLREYINLL